LRTHPVTTTRIAEAKARAEARRDGQAPRAPVESPRFALIRERIRVLESQDPPALLTYYAGRLERQGASTALHYGQTLAQIRARQFDAARRGAAELLAAQPDELCFKLLRAEVEVAAGQTARWQADYRALIAQYPRHRVVSHLYAQALLDLGSEAEAVEARELLRALAAQYGEDPAWHELLGRAHRLAGDRIRAGESYARAFALRGAYDDALRQLQDLARQPDLDFYQRARIDAQIAELTPRVLAMRREGFAGGTEGPRSSWRAPEADRPSGG
jgi:predicted Zn-dependent protease